MIVYDTSHTLWRYNMSGSVNKVTLVGNLGRDQRSKSNAKWRQNCST